MTAKNRALFKTAFCVGLFVLFITLYVNAPLIGAMTMVGACVLLLVYMVYRAFLDHEEIKERKRRF